MEDQRKDRVMAATVEKALILKDTVSMHQAAMYLASGGVPLDVSVRVLTTNVRRGMVQAALDAIPADPPVEPSPAPASAPQSAALPSEAVAESPAGTPPAGATPPAFSPSWREIVFLSGPTFR